MAEQVSHNVVDNTPSASASAPADVAADQTTTELAGNGNNATTTTSDIPTTEPFIDAKNANDAAITTNGSIQNEHIDSSAELNGTHDAASQVGSQEDAGSVDPSVTSDTEGRRGDGSDLKKEGGHHVRANSVKKPISFSKVSVTKSFLAKSASPAPPAAASTGAKPSPLAAPVQPAALRPRLVAKTAGSQQGMTRPRVGSESAGVPDASKVWNKNRPVAPPPPKHFTDEELKQQYGIHLATRLQSDENGKESKWADIDEDEEDWAPEAVVWMDGTKSTLASSEVMALEEKQHLALQQQEQAKPEEPTRPVIVVKKTELGPQKTILKPGNAGKAAAQLNRSATASPSGDKPSLKSKSQASAPAKSPWASLPPVEAAPLINPPVQQQTHTISNLPSQDARAYDQQTPSQPARQIAADTFERQWRDGEGAPRELFNSANGRYEPAPEGRRGSMRQDSSFRKPSLLQRPSQPGQGPAEPSAAFQTRSNSGSDGAPWPKRRGSNVSQGSALSGRRMSISRPSDLPPAFEEEGQSAAAVGHDLRASPASSRNDMSRPQFSQQTTWDQQMPSMPQQDPNAEDPVKAQERIMREKREGARKRRQEEAELEAKEKEERLKAKLAALEGSGRSRKEREAEAAAKAAAQTAVVEKPKEPASNSATPTEPAQASAVSPALEARLLPAPPTEAAKPVIAEEAIPSPIPAKVTEVPARPAASIEEPQLDASRSHLSPRANARAPISQQPSSYRSPATAYSASADRKQQPFGRGLGGDTFSSIPGWNTSASAGNVWGSSGIGNGTFDKSSAYAPISMSQQTSTLLPPPGMGRPSTSSRISPPSRGQEGQLPGLSSAQPSEQQRGFPPPGIDLRPDSTWGSSRHNGTSPAPGLGRQTHLPAPIAPPSRAQLQQQQPHQRDTIATWQNAAQGLPHQYSADADAAARKPQEQAAPTEASGTIRETFKKTLSEQGRLGGPRRFESVEYTVHDAQGSRSVSALSPAPPSTQTQPSGPIPTSSPLQTPYKQTGENTVRIPDGSRNPAHGGMNMQQQPPTATTKMHQQPLTAYHGTVNFFVGPLPGVLAGPLKDTTPPPPETNTHPVHGGDMRYPHVKLPPPPPRVKLPPVSMPGYPSPQQQQQTTVQIPGRPVQWGPPGVARPLVQNNEWQARFNGLFNRANVQTEVPPSPPKTPPKSAGSIPSLAITSFSKAEMDEDLMKMSATVSLPISPPKRKATTTQGFTIDDSSDIASKPSIDHMFYEELSFGSKPIVRPPPRGMRYNSDVLRASRNNHMFGSRVEPHSSGILPSDGPKNGIYVKIPGTKTGNKLVRRAAPAEDKQMRPQRGGHAGRAGRGRPRGRGGAVASPSAKA
ncbi:hypothetical protein LTR78_002288 [Recurvomyces mirabilis]|uniref:Uncharacterized protein n=1 Tax=Recurvomyces mirabilis TaxID=574656 RepID=A0AAE0WUS0_9PEZI|nr:hypothetical protein LTR78_002288 [Recurvomyces mirabilis]KAK5160743.1 hypothetical protein LTS14_001756 [Recurvomyces mirabilis]